MSDLKPRGIPITLDGVERHFLFTLNVIDMIQDKTGKTMHEVMESITNVQEIGHTLRDVAMALINDEAEREAYKNPETELKPVTEQEIGWIIGMDNFVEVTYAILVAYGYSLPAPEDEDPNPMSGQQSN